MMAVIFPAGMVVVLRVVVVVVEVISGGSDECKRKEPLNVGSVRVLLRLCYHQYLPW